MVQEIFKVTIIGIFVLLNQAFASSDSLVKEMLSDTSGYGCNNDLSECWNVDWLGEERFYIYPDGVKAIGKNALQSDACERVIRLFLTKEDALIARKILAYSLNRTDYDFEKALKSYNFSVISYTQKDRRGKIEEITNCDLELRPNKQ